MFLATLNHLLRYRSKPKKIREIIKIFLKRIYNAPGLFRILMRQINLSVYGARIGRLTIIGEVLVAGKKSLLEIGAECALGRCEIFLHDRVVIGDRVVINDGVKIITASHDTASEKWRQIAKPVTIHDYAWIATGAIIMPGVTIGRGSIVAAGSVVTKSTSPYSIVVGSPAKPIQKSRIEELDYSPVKFVAAYEAWLGSQGQQEEAREKAKSVS